MVLRNLVMEQLSSAEAILFFEDHKIVKEMTYLEFQAILDSYVPLHDMANRSICAVYVRINAKYHVTGAVFFRINFDREGFVEKTWNMALQQLADKATEGLNMGSGPVDLACFSQCPVKGQEENLWDPEMKAANNDFETIKKSIKNNSLGIFFDVDPNSGGVQSEAINQERSRTALIIKEQRLRQKLLSAKAQQDIRQLNLNNQEKMYNSQQKFDELEQALKNEKTQRVDLEDKSKGQLDKISGMRDYFEAKLEKYQQSEGSQSDVLKVDYDSRLEFESDRLAKEYAAELQTRDVELIYRREQENQLQQEIVKLKREKKALAESSREIVFHHLGDAGINFVIYHPGVGQLTIEPDEIDLYLSNNMAFVASKCSVSESLYRAWLDHYYSPTCQKKLKNGQFCDELVVQLDDPSQFIPGESNCCFDHRSGLLRAPLKSVSTSISSGDSNDASKNKNGPTGLAL
jgi:hypothetical protein